MGKILCIICIMICFIEIVWGIIQKDIVITIAFAVGAALWIYNLTQSE